MKISDYERAVLGEVRLVVPEHKPNGVKPLARWDGVVMIRKEKGWPRAKR